MSTHRLKLEDFQDANGRKTMYVDAFKTGVQIYVTPDSYVSYQATDEFEMQSKFAVVVDLGSSAIFSFIIDVGNEINKMQALEDKLNESLNNIQDNLKKIMNSEYYNGTFVL